MGGLAHRVAHVRRRLEGHEQRRVERTRGQRRHRRLRRPDRPRRACRSRRSSGEIVGVIGPNGAGKTTLFNVICGFVRADAGTLSLPRHGAAPAPPAPSGQARHRADPAGRRAVAGPDAWSRTSWPGARRRPRADFALGPVRAAALQPRGDPAAGRALELLDELHIAQYATAYPGALPYGIQKRVALARALMAEPDLLLLDEPASGLSTDDMDELGHLLAGLRSRMGVLLVEHHMDLVMSTCDRLVVLNFGRVIAAGPPGRGPGRPARSRPPTSARTCEPPGGRGLTMAAARGRGPLRLLRRRPGAHGRDLQRRAGARSPRSSGPTGPARRRCCARSAAWCRPRAGTIRFDASGSTGLSVENDRPPRRLPRARGSGRHRRADRRGEPPPRRAVAVRAGASATAVIEEIYELFPPLADRRRQLRQHALGR